MIRKFGDGRDWFFKEKLGMFIHWGIYSITGWHEQVLWRGGLRRSNYEKLKDEFNPVRFNPDDWLDLAESAGMTFVVFTAKHHDGFCMYDTKYTDYNVMNTPYGKDVLGILTEACKKRGIKLGVYYSLPDWHHPNYPNIGRHHELFSVRKGDAIDEEKYLEFITNQVRELCTNYGEIHEFFWDVNVAEFYDPTINDMLRQLQPNMVINDRGPSEGDFGTPERCVPAGMEFNLPIQACQSLGSQSWGYRKDEDYYTSEFIISSIDKILAMGGSYLLNVGPCSDGSIANEYWKAFSDIGSWYKRTKDAFSETYSASYLLSEIENNDSPVLLTREENDLYVHFPNQLSIKGLVLKGIKTAPKSAIVINNGQKVEFRMEVTPSYWNNIPYLHLKNLSAKELKGETMIVRLRY